MSIRKPGFYWVRRIGHPKPEPAVSCVTGSWLVMGQDRWWEDDEFDWIGPMILAPEVRRPPTGEK